ncbi:MAG: oligosaccharide flippase family protein [Steroidobacteraceae bacterium]
MTAAAGDRPAPRRWLANIGSGYAEAAVGGVIYLALTPILVRTVGVEAYGVWLLSHAITFYLKFFDFGCGDAQVRLHARLASRDQRIAIARLVVTVAVTLALTGGLAALIALGLAMAPTDWWLESSTVLAADFRIVLAILGANLLITIPGSALENVYEGAQRFDLLNARSIVLRLVAAGLQLALVLNGHGIVALALVELATSVLGVVIDLVMIGRLYPGLMHTPARFHRRTWRHIRRYSFWSAVDDIVAEGTVNLDEILIAMLLPIGLMTPYAIAVTLGSAMLVAIGPLTDVLYPMIAGLHARHRDADLKALFERGTKGMFMLALPIALCTGLLGPAVVAVWVPEVAHTVTGPLLWILVVNGLVSALLSTSTIMLLALGRVRLMVGLTALEVLVEVVLIVLLAPRHGLAGVAAACLIANASIGLLVELPITCRLVGTPVADLLAGSAVRPVVSALPAAVLGWWLGTQTQEADVASLATAAAGLLATWGAGTFLIGTTASERRELLGLVRGPDAAPLPR